MRMAKPALTPEACLRHDAPNGARGLCGEPSGQRARPASEGER
jgi:hypothetical protein